MLTFTDIVVLCMPLAAAILAVMKDTFKKEEKPGAKKKITPIAVAALFLATIGFGLSLYSTYQSKKRARENQMAEEDFRGDIKKALNNELPGAISQAIKDSQDQLNQSVSDAVAKSKSGLETAIDRATEKSSGEVQSAIRISGNAVAVNLADAINKSQARIENTLGTTETKINASIQSAEIGIAGVVNKSQGDIKASVEEATRASGNTIQGVISQAVQDQTRTIGQMAERAVGEQIMQIPLRIDQHQKGRLGGPLSDIVIQVGDVSKNKAFTVAVFQENGPTLYRNDITPRKGEWIMIPFTHPGNGKSYQLEMTVQTQHNLFGSGLDYVVIRATSLLNVARK